jgi:hypothetical protein
MIPTLVNGLSRSKEDIDDGYCSSGHGLHHQHLTMV